MANEPKQTPSATGTAPVVNDSNTIIPDENAAPAPDKTKTAKAGEKKIEVSEDLLKSLLEKVSSLEEKTNQYEQTASQDQIRRIEALRASGKLVKAVKIKRCENKLVIGWRTVADDVWFENGKLMEKQDVEVFFADGTKKVMSMVQFTRSSLYEAYEVITEAKTANGDIEFIVMLPDGKELKINSKYVN